MIGSGVRKRGGRDAAGLALLCALLAGCATVSFKAGASGEAIGADEKACRAETTSESAYAECMKKRGLFVAGGGSAPAGAPATVVATPLPAVPVIKEAARALPAGTSAPTATPIPAAPVVAETAPAAAPVGSSEHIKVASWWKLGANPGDLDRAIDACVATLGSAHRPDAGATIVTIALRDCLRGGGWYAVGTAAAP